MAARVELQFPGPNVLPPWGSPREGRVLRRSPSGRTIISTLAGQAVSRGILTVAVLICGSGLVRGQAAQRSVTKFYADFSDTADALLRNAASHARDKQWGEAVEIYQRVIQQFGDKVAKHPKDDPAVDPSGDSVLYVDIRHFCQWRLAALPPEARALYRSRVDTQAERWYRSGESRRDRALLRRVVDQTFCSSWGDDAVDLLGDLAFQDGRFDEALEAYRHLVPDAGVAGTGLVHPDPDVDLARVAAKKLLCRAALGENPPGSADLEAFGRSYAGKRGKLAGRDGIYGEILAAALKNDRLAPPAQPDSRWPTFAGSPTRTRVVPGSVDVGSLQWRVDLDPVKVGGSPRGYRGVNMVNGPTRPDKLLAYHPIVLGDQVIVCDEARILAYNLNDRPDGQGGTPSPSVKLAWKHDEDQGGGVPQAARMTVGVPRFTLTAYGDRVYARMGLTSVPFMNQMGGGGSQSYLIAVDRSTDGKLLWKRHPADVLPSRRPGENSARNLGFEGTPVADARNVYVALTDRREQTATYVVALDGESGAVRWVRYLGAASPDAQNVFAMGMGMGGGISPNDYGHRLLSLDGSTVYYQTNLGAVAALDAETGQIRWVATYPRLDRATGGSGDRDLNPAVVYEGLVIVAPDDSNAIYAFEATGGRLAWKTEPLPDEVKLTHLLGVAKGRVIATGDRVLLFDVKNGKLVHSWPDTGHGYDAYGRGLLAGDKIYWPTHNEIHVLNAETGLRTDPPIKLQETFQEGGGNLALGDGYLIVAQERKLVVFCQNRRLIQRYRDEIARNPDQAASYFRLARAAEATGEDDLALDNLDSAIRRARPSETVDGAGLGETSRDHRLRLLVKMGDKAKLAGELATAERRYHEAFASARAGRDRLLARLAEADVQQRRGAAAESARTLQSVLADDRLRSLDVTAEDGRRTIRADLLIGDRLATVVRENGRAVYAEFDARALELFERGRTAGDPRVLEEVGKIYPVARVVPDAWLALGRHHEERKRPSEAVRAYKRLLALDAPDALRARALLGLARSYEAQRLWTAARAAYAQALARFPRTTVENDDLGGELPLASLVTARLARPPFDRMTGDGFPPTLPSPLTRGWSRNLDATSRPLTAVGVPPAAFSGQIFLAYANELRPIEVPTGESRWSADLGAPPVWVGYLDDRVVAASEERVIALDLERGGLLWRFDATAAGDPRRPANPFDRPGAAGRPAPGAEGKFHDFRLVGGRVYCLRGERELIALDGESGQPDWSFVSPASEINPNLLVTPDRVVLQVRKPNAALVLEAATGRRRSEFALGADDDWVRPPLPLDEDHVVLVPDRRTVVLFDVSRGVNSWVFRESSEMPKNGPPRLFGDAEHLLMVHDGNELIRLDAATGVKRWSRPLGVENLSDRAESIAVDVDRVYWVNNRTLTVAQLSDGALVWSRFLAGPSSGWDVVLAGPCVLAYPGQPGRVVGGIEGLPLVLRRRDDGALVQRLLFSDPVTAVAVRLISGGVMVATQSAVWSLGERTPVDGIRAGR